MFGSAIICWRSFDAAKVTGMASIHGQFKYEGLYPTGLQVSGCWMRDRAKIVFRCATPLERIDVKGTFLPNSTDLHSKYSRKKLSLKLKLAGMETRRLQMTKAGVFEASLQALTGQEGRDPQVLTLTLQGVAFTNFLALLGRVFKSAWWLPKRFRGWLQPFRRQHNNRQVLVRSVQINGEALLDLDRAHSAFDSEFIFRHSEIGLNVVGWFHGFLGVGESARACVHAAESAGLKVDAVSLNLNLEGGKSADLWKSPLNRVGGQSVTIAHVDAPQSLDLVDAHPSEMAADRYRIGYWAWELPEFPDAWIQYASVFDEIWCPSEFCRQAMAAKLPIPVMTMPHAIKAPEVQGDVSSWRKRFKLPTDKFLFLFSFDLNSYAPRKNPEAVIEAYRKAFADQGSQLTDQVGLVLKMYGKGYSREEREQLEQLKSELPNLYFVDEALSREELTGLQSASDCFVSLHRSEGFGLAVAEMMALGKPVISTNWSATSEFVNESTGCPVAFGLVELECNVGPYTKGQLWAEADTDDAARWMQKVVNDVAFRKRISEKGKAYIANHLSPALIGQRYLERLKAITLFSE